MLEAEAGVSTDASTTVEERHLSATLSAPNDAGFTSEVFRRKTIPAEQSFPPALATSNPLPAPLIKNRLILVNQYYGDLSPIIAVGSIRNMG